MNLVVMNKLIKKLIIPVILGFFSLTIVSASDNSDCWRFGSLISDWGSFWIVDISRETTSNRYTNFLTIQEQTAIIRKDDLNTALFNLKKYCCDNDIWSIPSQTCKQDEPYYNSNVLESPYLFDHLFDVIIRRFNWLIKASPYKKMSRDPKWTSWRNWIDSIANGTKSTPNEIITKYQQTWKVSSPGLWYDIAPKIYNAFWNQDDQDLLTYVSWKWNTKESRTLKSAMKSYSNRTLYDRYINSCALGEYFYALLNVGVNSEDEKKIVNKLSDRSCDKVVEKHINWENAYVSLVIHKSETVFLSPFVVWYMSYLEKL